MVRKLEDQKRVTVNGVRGGEGPLDMLELLKNDERNSKIKMFHKIIIPPGSSVGYHRHDNEQEIYYVLKGELVFTDNDGNQVSLKAGDITNTFNTESHSMANNSDQEAEFIGLIITD